jgi:tetratricopeptide (TPR) repeat protein
MSRLSQFFAISAALILTGCSEPSNVDFENRARAALAAGDVDEAIEYYREGLRTYTGAAAEGLYRGLARVYEQESMFRELRRLVEFGSVDVSLKLIVADNAGESAFDAKRWRHAIHFYERAADLTLLQSNQYRSASDIPRCRRVDWFAYKRNTAAAAFNEGDQLAVARIAREVKEAVQHCTSEDRNYRSITGFPTIQESVNLIQRIEHQTGL